jgi:hypothetical protein
LLSCYPCSSPRLLLTLVSKQVPSKAPSSLPSATASPSAMNQCCEVLSSSPSGSASSFSPPAESSELFATGFVGLAYNPVLWKHERIPLLLTCNILAKLFCDIELQALLRHVHQDLDTTPVRRISLADPWNLECVKPSQLGKCSHAPDTSSKCAKCPSPS